MTRINAGIPPKLLCNKHLLAEHREIKRIPNMIAKHGLGDLSKDPCQFTLGKGHVRFFYPYQRYLVKRYLDIYLECIRRGFNVQLYTDAWTKLHDIQDQCFNDLQETTEMTALLAERINTRLGLDPSLGLIDWHSLIDRKINFD